MPLKFLRETIVMNHILIFLISAILCLSTSPIQAAVTHHGKVTAVGVRQISIQDESGDIEQFDVDPKARITHNGKPAMLDAIDSGDVAKLTLKTKRGKLLVVVIDARDSE